MGVLEKRELEEDQSGLVLSKMKETNQFMNTSKYEAFRYRFPNFPTKFFQDDREEITLFLTSFLKNSPKTPN